MSKTAKALSSPSSPTTAGSPTTASDSSETQLDKDTVLLLQRDLLELFASPTVQRKLREIHSSGVTWRVKWRMLLGCWLSQIQIINERLGPVNVKSPPLEAILHSKEQQKLHEKYGLDTSFSELKDLISIWKDLETDPDVYVNHAAIQEALGFSMVKDPDIQMPIGYKAPFNKQSLLRLMKSLLRSYSEPDFSKAIEDLKSRADASKEGAKIQKDGYYHLPGREAVAFAVQEQLLPCFGLPASKDGVKEMVQHCAKHLDDTEVAQLLDAINSKLGMSSNACERFRKMCKDL